MNLVHAFGQTKEEKINDIREKFQKINQDTVYIVKTLNNEQFLDKMTDGGGSLIGYYKGEKIYKIIERVGVSYCVRTFEYYFWEDQLIFVYESELDPLYNESKASFDWGNVNIVFEGRYYFDKGKLIEIKVVGKKRIVDDQEENKERILSTDAKRNIALLKK